MFAVNNLTASGNQTSACLLADGSTVTLTFRYRAAVQRWTVDVAYRDYVNNGMGLATHPNLLRDWRLVIPFGLQVATVDGTDPFLADDLAYSPGGGRPRVVVRILDATNGGADVADVEAKFFAGAGAA